LVQAADVLAIWGEWELVRDELSKSLVHGGVISRSITAEADRMLIELYTKWHKPLNRRHKQRVYKTCSPQNDGAIGSSFLDKV